MSFLLPKAPDATPPPPPPPPPSPPTQASGSVRDAGAAARAAAAAAAGSGFDNTIGSSTQGAPAASTAKKALLGGEK